MATIVHSSLTNSQLSTLPISVRSGGRSNLLTRLVATFRAWRQGVHERAALARLTQRELSDFGANSADVYRELSRPFWTLPPL